MYYCVCVCVCVCARKDWGALILVDDRFGKGIRYTRGNNIDT